MLSNALLLTLIELLLRGMTMLFQRYLAGAVGAAGLGLLQLVLTVGGFAMTLGLSGLRVTAMYLCAEEYGRQNPGGMRRAIESCLKTGALISSLAGLLLFFLSDAAAAHWIGDVRACRPGSRLQEPAQTSFGAYAADKACCRGMPANFPAPSRSKPLPRPAPRRREAAPP